MKNDDNKIKEVRNTVNLISGAYTLPLIEKLFPNSQKSRIWTIFILP